MGDETLIVSVRLPNGAIAGVEATVLPQAPDSSEEDRRIALEIPSMEGVTKAIEGMTLALWQVLKKVAPQKATVEFGFEIAVQNGELTGFFVKGSGKTNMKVTLEWHDAKQASTDSNE